MQTEVIPRVGHIKSPFLPISETFIYGYISHLKRYQPVVISEYLMNQDQFPVEHFITHRSAGQWYEKSLRFLRNWLVGRIPRELIMARFYRQALSRSNILLIHIHFGVPGMLLTPIKRSVGRPAIVSFYGYDLSQVPRALGEDIYRRTHLFETMEAFVVEGNHARQVLMDLGCPEEKITVIHIGVDLNRFDFGERKLGVNERPKILFCGRLVPKKGLLCAVRALALVRDRSEEFEFFVIGEGDQGEKAKILVGELNLQDRVHFLGSVPYKELPNWYRKCHILVAPSMTVQETGETEGGAPTVLLEAQATGLPVVSTTHADIPEVVQNGRAGLLSKEGDVEGLAGNLLSLLQHPEKWAEMGRAGRLNMEREYDIVHQTEHLERLYDQLLCSSSPPVDSVPYKTVSC